MNTPSPITAETAQAWLRHAGMDHRVECCELLAKGYSSDSKYVLSCEGLARLLLRVSGAAAEARRRAEFEAIRIHYDRGVACPEPIAFGCTPDGQWCFTCVEYLTGSSAEEVLPRMDPVAQRLFGIAAGCELFKLHQLHATESHPEWLKRRIAKYRRRVEEARQLGLGFADQENVEAYVERHLKVLESSPVRFQHDDFHPGNLIVREGNEVGVIDFNRCDWGDPVEDFYKVPWFAVPVSTSFACGQIEGYLSCGRTERFWARYNLFVAMNLHGSLVWEHHTSPPDRQARWQRQIYQMLADHDFAGKGPPRWFAPAL